MSRSGDFAMVKLAGGISNERSTKCRTLHSDTDAEREKETNGTL
jgi:hypothetical protein